MNPSYLNRITLRQVQIFLAVCQHESYSRAADELALTQPAVSAQVRTLEEIVGAPLFEYLGKQLYRTPEGEALRLAGRDILQRLLHLEMELAELRGVVQGSLLLGIESSAQYFMPRLLALFRTHHPAIDVQLDVVNHQQALKGLTENRFDLVVMGQVPNNRNLLFVPFRQNTLLLVSHPAHPLADEPNINLPQLATYPILLRELGSGTRQAFEEHCASQAVKLPHVQQLGSLEAIKATLLCSPEISVLPEDACRRELAEGSLKRLSVPGFPLRRSWCLVQLRAKHLTPVAEAFTRFLLDGEGTPSSV